jgi:manganese/zinc/iron transport system ATP- binding protein
MPEVIPLEIHDMTVAYRRKPVLWDVDLTVPESTLTGIVGPNGAGKSTLIKAALGLLPLSSGWVKFWGEPYEKMRHRIGYVPQRESVDWDFPVTALDVVMMGRYGRLGWVKRPGKADRRAATQALERIGMAEFAERQISNLSGGQQQRVFLARALVQEAQIYFMDEPFAGVDASTEKAIIELLEALRCEGHTVLVVHHDLNTIREYFDRLILLNMRVIASGSTAEIFTTENMRKTYGGRLTILDSLAQTMAGR